LCRWPSLLKVADVNAPENEPDAGAADATSFRRLLDHVHWYVLVLGLVLIATTSFVEITSRFFAIASLVGFAIPVFSVIAVRQNNSLYATLGLCIGVVGLNNVYRMAGYPDPGGWASMSAFGVGLFIPCLLLWIGRPWVRKFCRLDESTTPAA
jgi:hypothetical protein